MRKEPKQTFLLTEQPKEEEVVSTPVNESKYEFWKEEMFHKNENGYYTDVVVGFRYYWSEEEVRADYLKLKKWCEAKDKTYLNFYGEHNYQKYIQ